MRGFKLTQFEMLETILASDKEFIDAAVTGGTVQQREDLELLNQDGAGEGEGDLVQGVRGSVGCGSKGSRAGCPGTGGPAS